MNKPEAYLLRTDAQLSALINNTLDSFSRTIYPTKADLLREALAEGLKVINDRKNAK